MLNLSKSYDYFQPEKVRERIHIIGCGAVGSTIAELLVRNGLKKITLYDFDRVEPHNIANQMYREPDIGKLKVEALRDILVSINSGVADTIKLVPSGYTNQKLSGYVFLCLDNIDTRRAITEANVDNPYIKAVFDVRIRLEDGQHYAANWKVKSMVDNLVASMQFTHEEAMEQTPVTACGLELSFAGTVRGICTAACNNFVRFVRTGELFKTILFDAAGMDLQAYP